MTYVERGYLPKDQSSGRRPSLPATTESPLFTCSVGHKKTRSLGRCPGSLPLFETDLEDETRRQNKARNTRRDQTHTQNRKRRPEGRPTHPGHQETRARKRAHRRAGEPGSFHHVLVRLEGRDSGCIKTLSRVPVLLSRLRHHADSARERRRRRTVTHQSTTTAGTAFSHVLFNTFGSICFRCKTCQHYNGWNLWRAVQL